MCRCLLTGVACSILVFAGDLIAAEPLQVRSTGRGAEQSPRLFPKMGDRAMRRQTSVPSLKQV